MPEEPKVLKPPSYHGERDMITLEGWIDTMDRYFRLTAPNKSEEILFEYAASYLRGAAWYVLKVYKPETWSDLKKTLRERFTPVNRANHIQHEFFTIRQVTSVREYNERFLRLATELPPEFQNPKVAIAKYLEGLKKNVKSDATNRSPKTLIDAMTWAETTDDVFAGSRERWNPEVGQPSSRKKFEDPRGEPMEIGALQIPAELNGKLTSELKRKLREENRCFLCRKKGHRINNCPDQAKNGRGQY
uniref:ARAD1B13904p n=1 Tax=Blastobotrys adeninivorans TaxID=409370 RepID=A0A060TC47_BLAAD